MSSDEHDCWEVVKKLEAENVALKAQLVWLRKMNTQQSAYIEELLRTAADAELKGELG